MAVDWQARQASIEAGREAREQMRRARNARWCHEAGCARAATPGGHLYDPETCPTREDPQGDGQEMTR